MLGQNDLRKIAARSGARDIGNVEIDVILTYLLQLFTEKKITDQVAFKGGTMLRKMVFGPRGRLSTDLDFTCRTDISNDDLMVMMLDALSAEYQGLKFTIEDRDWYQTDDGCAVNPICAHADNEAGIKIKLQVSMREKPILPVRDVPQLKQEYFEQVGFDPAAIPSLAFEEAVAEKIRAASRDDAETLGMRGVANEAERHRRNRIQLGQPTGQRNDVLLKPLIRAVEERGRSQVIGHHRASRRVRHDELVPARPCPAVAATHKYSFGDGCAGRIRNCQLGYVAVAKLRGAVLEVEGLPVVGACIGRVGRGASTQQCVTVPRTRIARVVEVQYAAR